MKTKIFLIALLLLIGFIHPARSQKLDQKIKLENINLKRGYNYDSFTSNNDYLVWGEYYTKAIFIYDLHNHQLNKLKLRRGRGPHEFNFFTSLTLTPNDNLIIADPPNTKLIVYNIDSKKFSKDIKFRHHKPYRINATEEGIFVLNNAFSARSIYYIYSFKKGKTTDIDMQDLNVLKEFSYPFKRYGRIAANHSFGIHLSRYYPYLYVSNLKKKKFIKKIQFDSWQTKKGSTTSINGKKAFRPPTNTDVINKDIVFVPGMDHTLLVLAKGKSQNRKYKTSELNVYDIKKNMFTEIINLDLKASRITANDNYLFVYSRDKNAIYRYKTVNEK